MVDISEIHPLTDFQRRTKEHIQRLKDTGRPEVLTVNGRPALVVQDAAAYQRFMDRVNRLMEEQDQAAATTAHRTPEELVASFLERRKQLRLEGLTRQEMREEGRR